MTLKTAIPGNRAASATARVLAIVAPALLALLPLSTTASEAGSLCRQIEHRLAAVSAVPHRAQDGLARAVRLSRQAGCGPNGFASPRDTHCRAHASRIQALRSSGFAPGDAARERSRLKAALRANGCQRQQVESPRQVVRVKSPEPAVRTMDGTIPVPMPRPASPSEIYQANYVKHARTRMAAIDMARLEELAQPRAIPPSRQSIRIVGGRFLAQPDAETNFIAIATGSESAANEILGGVLAIIGDAIVSKAVAAEP
ncbi:hypothetical protein [Aquibium microcysteis]|uniref:hypothetical protein n=1 Tax=Aquibium microcysteis TaxID=675281 RepID=UPI00165D14A2|nr:hypothetical protein [Aquibium microcysteis]